MADSADIVATWNVPMSNTVYKVEFFHGTTTGRRVIRVNGREILKRDWMFKLVGREIFEINNIKCVILIEAIGIFAYEYTLNVGGKSFKKFREEQSKALQVWHVTIVELENNTINNLSTTPKVFRVCLEKDLMDIWVNDAKIETTGEFLDNGGTRTHFGISESINAYIESVSSGKRKTGIVHQLYVNGQLYKSTIDENLE